MTTPPGKLTPDQLDRRSVANFYLALLHAVGDRREKFGEIDPALQGLRDVRQAGPLTELLAGRTTPGVGASPCRTGPTGRPHAETDHRLCPGR